MNKICPLLKHPEQYNPDTIDLLNNTSERDYWLPCLARMVQKFVKKAGILNPNQPCATARAEECSQKFHDLIDKVTANPKILKPLSIRTLLEFNEDNLRDNHFPDAWSLQKHTETTAAFKEFKQRIEHIDSICDFHAKWVEIVTGVLAGNVFDWGAAAVANILETEDDFSLARAMDTIEKRPWFCDNLDVWIDKLKTVQYTRAVVFVDNAGVDFVLGILPLARELLLHGTTVILSANSFPALNDVTSSELKLYCCEAARYCAIIDKAISDGQLLTIENGQRGPCLDLSNLPQDLSTLMEAADLVVLEGMGRSVHTNFYAKFNVDSVKLAVLKNEWLAKSLGAQQFSVIFNYESASSNNN